LNHFLKKIFQNHSTRVLAILFVALVILIGYFLVNSYYVQLEIHKNKILAKLEAIANTTATQINGNQIEYLFEMYPKRGDLRTNYQDRVYQHLHEQLKSIKRQNYLSSALYTLTYDSAEKIFLFGVSSANKPYLRYKYEQFPQELLDNYRLGGRIDVYGDKSGHWLSAFAPIRNSEGKTVAIIQADHRFDEFLDDAEQEIFINIGITLLVTLFVLYLLLRSMRYILRKEDILTRSLIQSKSQLEDKNKDILDSILYAKKIQEAILPDIQLLKEWLPQSFVYHSPRDIVSGDFYWFKKINGKLFIACVDCTGHGVPGAFMSMVGNILLDDVITKKKIDKADIILNELHNGVVKALRQKQKEKASKDGMDIALCIIDEQKETVEFAGAFRPLVHVRENSLTRIKSNAAPIGGFRGEEPIFNLHTINYQKGDVFYIYTDGYADQFGGERGKKFMTKKFREFLLSINQEDMDDQKELLKKEFDEWRGSRKQVDDVLVIGFKM